MLGGIYTWWALRHRGMVAAVRAAGLTLLPIAAWLTGLLQVFGTITDAIGNWLARLVFSPSVWLGMVVFVVAIVMIVGANALARRGSSPTPKKSRRSVPGGTAKAVAPTSPHDPLIDDEMAEIQEILKKRGIS